MLQFPAVPHAVSDILNSTLHGRIDADRYIKGKLNPILVKGLIVARSRRASGVKACLAVTPHNGSVQYNQVTLLKQLR